MDDQFRQTIQALSDSELEQFRLLCQWSYRHPQEYTIHEVGKTRWQARMIGDKVELYFYPLNASGMVVTERVLMDQAIADELTRRKVEQVTKRMLASVRDGH